MNSDPTDGLPQQVAEAMDAYQTLLASRGPCWAETERALFPWSVRHQRYVPLITLIGHAVMLVLAERPGLDVAAAIEAAPYADLDTALRDALAGERPAGLVAVRLTCRGPRAEHGPARAVLPGATTAFDVLLDSGLDRPVEVSGPWGRTELGAGAARLVAVHGDTTLTVDGAPFPLDGLTRPVAAATLRVRSGQVCRWSVADADGTGWFPDGALVKYDAHGRPFFHGDDVTVRVPAELPLRVTVARGMDFGVAETAVGLAPGEEGLVRLDPPRRRDPAAAGWYGGDLHLHMNFGGDQVCRPEHAAVMQHGEGLHVMNLLAANCATSFVFDREALAAWAGEDLPWSDPGAGVVARMGAEYRNDLLGHLHGFGISAPPAHWYSGHADSDRPDDDPPNAVACEELRALGGIVCASHPFNSDTAGDDPGDAAVAGLATRSTEAREFVADAALGLVDGLDVLTHLSCRGTAGVYRRLLGAGLRPAATAGTDVFLSYGRAGLHSNPPGWARVYAKLDGEFGVASFQEAVRRGATFATNGPWLELTVDGHGPGGTLDVDPGTIVTVTARAEGPGVGEVRIRTGHGILAAGGRTGPARGTGSAECAVSVEYTVGEPTYVVAEADGEPHPEVLDPRGPYAHTSGVFLDVAGRHVAHAADVRWCLDWLDGLERLAASEASFGDPGAFASVLERARAYYMKALAAGDEASCI